MKKYIWTFLTLFIVVAALTAFVGVKLKGEDYKLTYVRDYNFKIPAEALECPGENGNVGKAYLLNKNNKAFIYLDYAFGNNLSKPEILNVKIKDGNAVVFVKRPDQSGVRLAVINPHYFTIELKENIKSVKVVEINKVEYVYKSIFGGLDYIIK